MQPIVSSLFAGDCPVHRLGKNFFLNRCTGQSPADSDDTRGCIYTRSDSKVMRLVPKKSYIYFIHQLKYGHLQNTSIVPAHTFSSGAAIVCSIPGTQLEECCLRPALQTSGCLLLTQNGVLSLPILFFGIKRSRRARDQVSKEAVASP